MKLIKYYIIKIKIIIRILKNYSLLSKNNSFKTKTNNIYKVILSLIISKILFRLLFILNKNQTLKFIENNNFIFSIRSVDLNEKKYISDNVKKFNSFKQNFFSQKLLELNENGFVYLGNIFSSKDCKKFINYLDKKEFYNSQQPLQSDGKKYIFSQENLKLNKFSYSTFLPDQFLNFPKLKIFLSSKSLLNLINSYLKFNSTIYSALTWVNLTNKNKHYVHNLHRDYDDFKFIVLIINWTDVTKYNGATRFVKKTHKINNSTKLSNQKNTVYLEGKRGTVYLADTYALHSGTPLIEGIKVSSWIRFGKLINAASIQDGFVTTPYIK